MRDGSCYVSDWRGGVTHIRADGSQQAYLGTDAGWLRPNGIALCRDGSFLIAHLGDITGGVFRLQRNGCLTPVATEIDCVAIPPTNFVAIDRHDRYWLTVSTRKVPRAVDYRPDACSGFIAVIDARGARIVADGLGYTNEIALTRDDRWLYVNETFGRRLSRFAVGSDGALSQREVITEFGHGTYPDGMALDVAGGIWIASLVSNRIIRVALDGRQDMLLADSDLQHIDQVEHAFLENRMNATHLATTGRTILRNTSSIAFGGSSLNMLHIGSLQGTSVARLPATIAGQAPVHWEWT